MKKVFIYLALFFLFYFLTNDLFESINIILFVEIIVKIFVNSTKYLVFKEWALLLYAINYLIAPMLTYRLSEQMVIYSMKIDKQYYFSLCTPAFLLFYAGLNVLPTKIFNPDFTTIKLNSILNQSRFLKLTFIFLGFDILSNFVLDDLGFLFNLLGLLKFITAFALFAINSKKYKYLILFIFIIDMISSFLIGMFHDVLMWTVFFGFFFLYVKKPSIGFRLIAALAFIVFVLFIQAFKTIYRADVWAGDKSAGLSVVRESGSRVSENNLLFESNNLFLTLARSNQAWIFASTVDNMDRTNDFQGLNNIYRYMEAALLPRFLAPDKIRSGDKQIFNQFSGHYIEEKTAMGLGIFADGYIAYGRNGVYIFGFLLGLLFSVTFRIIENWSNVSPFYCLLMMSILTYAVRPDCELQTIINHIVKGILVYGILVYLSRVYFTFQVERK